MASPGRIRRSGKPAGIGTAAGLLRRLRPLMVRAQRRTTGGKLADVELQAEVRSLRESVQRLKKQRNTLQRRCLALESNRDEIRDLRREDRARTEGLVAELHRRTLRDSPASQYRRELQYLFVVTYGRSGSTLLQGILNSQPGVLIRGENGGVVRRLFEYNGRLVAERADRSRAVPSDPRNAWHGIDGYPEDLALDYIRGLVTDTLFRPFPETWLTGFKEIRWPGEDLAEFLSFLQRVFPGARFAFNTRNLDDVAGSSWHADDTNARTKLAAAEQWMLDAAATLGSSAYHVHYDDYVANPESLADFLGWAGHDEIDMDRVRRVMDTRHSTLSTQGIARWGPPKRTP